MTARNDAPSSAYLLRNPRNGIDLSSTFPKKSDARERFVELRLKRIAAMRPSAADKPAR